MRDRPFDAQLAKLTKSAFLAWLEDRKGHIFAGNPWGYCCPLGRYMGFYIGTGTKFVVDASPTLTGTPLAPTASVSKGMPIWACSFMKSIDPLYRRNGGERGGVTGAEAIAILKDIPD